MESESEYKKWEKSLESSVNHPRYSEHLSAEENVKLGREYRGGQSYKKVAAQLQQIANLDHKRVFEEAAEIARRRAHERHEYKSDRREATA